MQCGDRIEVRARKSDGTVYRWWYSTVEYVDCERIVTVNRAGDRVRGPAGGWAMKHCTRTIYWFARPYNLAEVYQPDGSLKQIYIHIATPITADDRSLSYVDLELDVVKRPGQPLRIMDEDEFDDAADQYGYTYEFKCSCRRAVEEALQLASCWHCKGSPATGHRRTGSPRRRYHPRTSREIQEPRTETPASDSSMRSTEV